MRTVYVIDDDVDVRKSLHFLLETASIRALLFAGADDFLALLPDLAPAPILIDVRMPGVDGLQLLLMLKQRGIAWPVVMMTAHGDVPMAVHAMKHGAIEFLEKPFSAETLDATLDLAFALIEQLDQAQSARKTARQQIARLTPRESDVLTLLMRGALNKVAAHRLGLSPRTVEMHRGNALAKLGLKTVIEVMALYARAGLVDPAPSPGDTTA